jgi:TonB family protein
MMEWIMRRAILASLLMSVAGCASAGMTNAERDAEFRRWAVQASEKIRSKIYYPYDPTTGSPRQSGVVLVRVTVRADGRIYTPQIEKPSGYPLFDAAALAIVFSASPLPPPPSFAVEEKGFATAMVPIIFTPPGARPRTP